ncbi:MAG: transcription elongation factor Spt5 [Candidatus Methanomethylophilaceae archaeon]|nr:transcription elongation factor Spt5 [Thermoplasmata archaeon]MBQ2762799.1 transcription elongation factor Spt5 [Candidatus Methanomethylophilaceae archaeon]
MIGITGDNSPKGVHAGLGVSWPFKVAADTNEVVFTFNIVTGPNSEDAPEWNVALNDTTGELWSNYSTRKEVAVDYPGKGEKEFILEIICPKGARFGEFVEVEVIATASGLTDSIEFKASATQSILVLKTQMDQEKSVADSLAAKANLGDKDIYAILSPSNLRGYLFVEGMNTDRMREKTRDIRKARSFVDGETSILEIDHYLTPLSTVVGIVEGDLVELVSGPFKGEKARVQQIDQSKEEITVELIEAMVPIPVTVKGDSVRVIEKEK